MIHTSTPPTPIPTDASIVEAQLGRSPRGSWRVARRCHLGVPMVIENHPKLDDGSPFPTLYWLTCPILVKRVSREEAEGSMNDINERLGADEMLRERLDAALHALTERRDSWERIEDSGAPPGGGPDRVKCLHAHTAHGLVDAANPVAAMALAATGWPDCIEPCYRVPS